MWPTPNVPNGGRAPKGGMTKTGMTPDGKKRQGLENQVKMESPHTPGVTGQLNPSAGTPMGKIQKLVDDPR